MDWISGLWLPVARGGLRVETLGFRVLGLGFRVQGFRVTS